MRNISIRLNVSTKKGPLIYAVSNRQPKTINNNSVRFHRIDASNPGGCLQLFSNKTKRWYVAPMFGKHDDIVNAIIAESDLLGYNALYFELVSSTYVNKKEDIKVTHKDEHGLLFNTPIHLMFAAALIDDVDVSFKSEITGETLVRLIRNCNSVSVYPNDSIIGSYNSVHVDDRFTVNNLNVRSIQYLNLMQLIRCKEFRNRINNGNMLTAFADSYHGSNDDDTLEVPSNIEGIATIHYDQFTGPCDDNDIEIYTEGAGTYRELFYKSNTLDESFVNMLRGMAINHITQK